MIIIDVFCQHPTRSSLPSAYGHMGRKPEVVTKSFRSRYEGDKDVTVELFTWEKLDYVDKVREAFGL